MAGNTHTRSRAKKLHFTRIQPGVGLFCRKKGSLGSAGEPVAAALLPTALLTVKNYYRADLVQGTVRYSFSQCEQTRRPNTFNNG